MLSPNSKVAYLPRSPTLAHTHAVFPGFRLHTMSTPHASVSVEGIGLLEKDAIVLELKQANADVLAELKKANEELKKANKKEPKPVPTGIKPRGMINIMRARATGRQGRCRFPCSCGASASALVSAHARHSLRA